MKLLKISIDVFHMSCIVDYKRLENYSRFYDILYFVEMVPLYFCYENHLPLIINENFIEKEVDK